MKIPSETIKAPLKNGLRITIGLNHETTMRKCFAHRRMIIVGVPSGR